MPYALHHRATTLLLLLQSKPTESVDAGDSGDGRREVAGRGVGLVEPASEQRLQLAHVLEAQVQSLEPRDGRL